MVSVQSSNITAVDYIDGELHVQFRGGGATYIYPGVSLETYYALLASDSKGSYFARCVKSVVPPTRVRKVPCSEQ